MALTVVVLSAQGARLTFDGTSRIVIGRGAGSDVRLPETSVSVRHASLRAQGSDFTVVDEGSTNGTFVGSVRVAPGTSRIVRSGDRLRLGRMWLELRVDHSIVTRDVAIATRDIALALVARALEAGGGDGVAKVKVVEGPDQGTELRLTDEGTGYLVGRGAHCDLPLADPDVSREHVRVERRGGGFWVHDEGTKNGTWIGETAAPAQQSVPWRPPNMVRVGRTVLALWEPLSAALATIEGASDEKVDERAGSAPPPLNDAGPRSEAQPKATPDASAAAAAGAPGSPPVAAAKSDGAAGRPEPRADPRRGAGWSVTDAIVMGAALCVLALSLAGLVWLLRG
jgi:pSer/pThr/pTyr-binding forkhead associated (FHA) protein